MITFGGTKNRYARFYATFAVWCVSALLLGATTAAAFPKSGRVTAVFDGDTILLSCGEKIRYLGVDAPEVDHEMGGQNSQCYADDAWRANREWVLGKTVKLEYEPPYRDRYGRLLAYVYTEDGRCVNLQLLRYGYAYLYRTSRAFKLLQPFLDAQREAISKRRGMWSACAVKSESFYVGNRRSYVFHRPGCPFGEKTSKHNKVRFNSRLEAFEEGYRPCRRCNP